ncbi:putative late blight resistance protein homolog R1B-17, partial [Capsicum annuum]|uniref:putative late blight resistance protein homolog R1B-17 n=1 Tax=Capsicum annuum TaxID=4072 RepID=UPI001FB04C93
VSSAVLREDIVNLLDFMERLKNEEDQIVLDMDQIEKRKLELTFLSDGSNADMSSISYEVHDLVQSLFHQSGDDMLVKLKDHVVPHLLENIKTSIISDHHSESSATMTEDQLVELLDSLLVNLHYLPKNVFGNLRDFHGLKVNGCIEHKAIEYVLPQFQLMAERVRHFYKKDEDEKDEDEDGTDEEDEDGTDIIPVSLEVMQICSTMLEASKWAELECFKKKLLEASPDILREHLIHLQQHMFDVRARCTVDQECNEKKLLQKIFNQVIGLKERFNEDDIDDDIADKLRKELFGKRYLVVLDYVWDTATRDELTRPLYAIPSEFQNGSRVILTSRKKEVALHGKCHSDPLDLQLLRPEESWELFEKRVLGEERCPDELKDVGEKIAEKCDGLPLVLDLIGGVISRKEKKEALWIEALNNLSSFIFKDEEEVMKVIQLSYDHLSDHLKPCFLYLGSYPKDKNIRISWLKDLWNGEGLLEPTDLKSVEEVIGEKRNPCAKHLLSLKIESGFLYNCHLRHLRLLKRLEVRFIILSDTVLNEIGMLVHLRCLRISMQAAALPPSFSNLCNLETLVVYNSGSNLVLSPTILSLAKLPYVGTEGTCSIFDSDNDKPANLENLSTLSSAAEQIHFPRLDVLNKLERVYAVTADESFPVLEELVISDCYELIEIPKSFGDIASLKSIFVWESFQLEKSALKIKKYVEEMTGKDELKMET